MRALLFSCVLLCCQARGAVPLHEDWNGGRIDASRWESAGLSINASLVDLGEGDWALKLEDMQGLYNNGIRSRAAFARGDNLRCTFRLWRKDQPLDWNGICGPFIIRNYSHSAPPGRKLIVTKWPRCGILDDLGRNNSFRGRSKDGRAYSF